MWMAHFDAEDNNIGGASSCFVGMAPVVVLIISLRTKEIHDIAYIFISPIASVV
jgi:hypothetical protein